MVCDCQSARTFECLGFCRINTGDAKLQAEGKMDNAECARATRRTTPKILGSTPSTNTRVILHGGPLGRFSCGRASADSPASLESPRSRQQAFFRDRRPSEISLTTASRTIARL
jgi:topoisomerase IA-like protein